MSGMGGYKFFGNNINKKIDIVYFCAS